MSKHEGWQGWDDYAPFYDWENARTLGRRDVPFWRRVARRRTRSGARARVRHRADLAAARPRRRRSGRHRSVRRRCSRARRRAAQASASRGRRRRAGSLDSSAATSARLPFADARVRHGDRAVRHPAVAAVATRPRRRRSSRSRGCSSRAALFGLDLVPDVPNWREYTNRVQLRGPRARRCAPHADRIGPAGSRAPADDVRAALRGAARPRRSDGAPVRADVPHAVGSGR